MPSKKLIFLKMLLISNLLLFMYFINIVFYYDNHMVLNVHNCVICTALLNFLAIDFSALEINNLHLNLNLNTNCEIKKP